MSEQHSDFSLLREFVRDGRQPALAALVREHVDLVYGTAFRKVEDSGAAQEISQNVFSAPARKACQFAPDDSVPAWLRQRRNMWRSQFSGGARPNLVARQM
jgi:DNA-directed RNA polymerase specialized sigma24 family protein